MTLREWREKKGLTMVELARMLGVDKSAVSRWESGERFPSRRFLKKIAEVTGGEVTANDFLKTISGR
jgi:transcriptional regulator with XRE-family HTH domain